ncbi:hypothetical protein [Photobacterium sp. OFAV2-7]|uniref:hypothetical protein n=1 Tax=Photobacterium sp. OFAV2-7 TaxID=2917748 RepID=UPI001EF4481C|nr:hypothetical protein [Photobacterium sp. OFAV2-7]MCG7586754.1 hypothetical protein [Photobacterium sp. OFAV2-7]
MKFAPPFHDRQGKRVNSSTPYPANDRVLIGTLNRFLLDSDIFKRIYRGVVHQSVQFEKLLASRQVLFVCLDAPTLFEQ